MSAFGRTPWGEAFRPARHDSLQGWTLQGPPGTVATQINTAFTPRRRMRGLLGNIELASNEALLIRPCSQVHGIGMRYAFDAVFCDADLRVLFVSTVRPRRVSRYVRGADCCVELRAGRAQECGIEAGSQLRLVSPQ